MEQHCVVYKISIPKCLYFTTYFNSRLGTWLIYFQPAHLVFHMPLPSNWDCKIASWCDALINLSKIFFYCFKPILVWHYIIIYLTPDIESRSLIYSSCKFLKFKFVTPLLCEISWFYTILLSTIVFLVHILTEMVSVVGQSLKDKISEELIELQGNNLPINMYLWARMKTLFHKYPRGKNY